MAVQASTVTFGNTLSAGVPNISRGDEVRFYEGGRLLEGKVASVGDEVRITCASGNFSVSPEAVVEILQVSPETTKQIQSHLQDYFSNAYGFEDYAKEMTDDLA